MTEKKVETKSKIETEFERSLLPASERHIPRSFEECIHSKKINNALEKLCKVSRDRGLPNLLLYGSAGSGKYTRAMVTLYSFFKESVIYGGTAKAIHPVKGCFTHIPGRGVTGKTDKAVFVISSPLHCEIDMEQANAEKCLVNFLDYFSKTKNVFLNCHKYVIIRHAERISHKTQQSLRRVMETKSNTTRFLVTCRSLCSWMDPLRSRFLCLPVRSPSEKEAEIILRDVAKKENWKLTKKRVSQILRYSRYGTSNAIHLADMLMVAEGSFLISLGKRSFTVYIPDRKKACQRILLEMKNGNREKMRSALEDIYVGMSHDFNQILTGDLFHLLLEECDNEGKYKLLNITAEWNQKRIFLRFATY
jgi:DNA polymerase III delta prime subunit